MGMNRHF